MKTRQNQIIVKSVNMCSNWLFHIHSFIWKIDIAYLGLFSVLILQKCVLHLKNLLLKVDYDNIFYSSSYTDQNWFYFLILMTLMIAHSGLWIRTPLWNNQNDLKLYGKCTYFAQIDYILVLAALTWAVGWKSTAMRKITIHTIWFPAHKLMPIRCPNP